MKRLVLCLVLITIAVIGFAEGSAEGPTPHDISNEGFFGIKWGDSISVAKQVMFEKSFLELVSEENENDYPEITIIRYKRKDRNVEFCFLNSKFAAVSFEGSVRPYLAVSYIDTFISRFRKISYIENEWVCTTGFQSDSVNVVSITEIDYNTMVADRYGDDVECRIFAFGRALNHKFFNDVFASLGVKF
ncbi:hypothetical protein FACS1894130_12040 [Spirochaetia bacterium]|nr:hypothetical protein FACS1894130_12040 [Spirochaetia bacterium]